MTDRILVAMSGGVDSSVAAALLQQAGWEVAGVTFKLFCYGGSDASAKACCGLEGVRDAQSTARRLGITHTVLDLSELFRVAVYDDFVREYTAGRTPNPCVQCNTHVKFGPLARWARERGFSHIATGHYVRSAVYRCESDRSERPVLARARDARKDQSYVLWGLQPEILSRVQFPLGEMTKDEIRTEASRLELPVWDKAESQDLCFAEGGSYVDVLRRELGEEHGVFAPGEIRDLDDRVLGRHLGLANYTVGQRKGLSLGGGEAYHVAALEPAGNVLRVASVAEVSARRVELTEVNLFVPREEIQRGPVEAKIRYRHTAQAAVVSFDGDAARVIFDEPQSAVAPGQSCVFYRDDLLLGGGRILSTDAARDRTNR